MYPESLHHLQGTPRRVSLVEPFLGLYETGGAGS